MYIARIIMHVHNMVPVIARFSNVHVHVRVHTYM